MKIKINMSKKLAILIYMVYILITTKQENNF